MNRTSAKTASRSRLGLTPEAIVKAASLLLERDGLGAVTMRGVAQHLGVGTMTLYSYFEDKDALLDAVVDSLGAEQVPNLREGSWRERLRELMLALHAQLIAHPFLVQLRLRRPLISPEAMRWTEAALQILIDAGLPAGLAANTFRPLFIFTFGHAAFTHNAENPELVARARMTVLSLPQDQYPATTEAAKELAGALTGSESYELGLDLLLTGIEALIRDQ